MADEQLPKYYEMSMEEQLLMLASRHQRHIEELVAKAKRIWGPNSPRSGSCESWRDYRRRMPRPKSLR
jgi:hypothetical protein